ncbi:MAG TPA: hypothetical protein DF712_08010 [Balneola sp.]|nr:hypothetical protein [Balneola sp.]|tara:strand:+ start:100 stop:477 length:378 start_codon:yes stop_codon:yes gene_type:complete
MFNIPLNDDNFILYASRIYDNPSCQSEEEFYEDLNRVKYIKRLFFRYDNTGELKLRLILNHIIILTNVFGSEGTTRILFYKSEDKYHGYIKSFLEYLNCLPLTIPELDLNEIVSDHRILEHLKQL